MREVFSFDIRSVMLDGGGRLNVHNPDYSSVRIAEGAVETLSHLHHRFGGQVWIVSQCGKRAQLRDTEWIRYHRILERTGIAREQVIFYFADHERVGLYGDLQVTHLADNRLGALVKAARLVPHRFLINPAPIELSEHSAQMTTEVAFATWEELGHHLEI